MRRPGSCLLPCLSTLLATLFAAQAASSQPYPTLVNRRDDGWPAASAWTLREEIRIGTLDGSGPDTFSELAALAVDSAGRIYVLEFQAQEVRVFGPDGSFLRRIGARGEGPGEFQRARAITLRDQRELWVLDIDPPRWSIFDLEGVLIDTHPRDGRGSVIPWPGGFSNLGLVDWTLDWELLPGGRVSSSAALVPTLISPSWDVRQLPPVSIDGVATSDGRPSLANRSLVVAQSAEGRLWFAHTDAYEVFERTFGGDTVRSFTLPFQPQRVDVDSVLAAYAREGRPIRRRDVHPYRRVLHRLVVDDAVDHMLVFPQEDGVAPGTVADVFRITGEFRGRIRLPDAIELATPPPIVIAGRLYAVTRDDFDVPYVVSWMIVDSRGRPALANR